MPLCGISNIMKNAVFQAFFGVKLELLGETAFAVSL